MVMLIILILGSATLLVSSLSRIGIQLEKDSSDTNLLAQAKEIVLGYAAGGTDVGTMFSPDRLITPTEVTNGVSGPPNYDGDRDGCQSNDTCLGRFPWKAFKMPISAPSDNDPTGDMPWYALSGNMNAPDAIPFNSDILNSPFHPWLTVRDMNGNIINSRVAIILLLPGPPLANQSRQQSPNLGGPDQYLDRITVPSNCTSPCTPGVTYRNDDLDNDFIMGDRQRWITDPSDSTKQIADSSYQFNDKLIYITIDELMPLIEKRSVGEIKKLLTSYYQSWNAYPFAMTYTDPSSTLNFIGNVGQNHGLPPIAKQIGGSPIVPVWSIVSSTQATSCVKREYPSNTCSAANKCVSARCSFSGLSAGTSIQITGTVKNIGLGFWKLYDPSIGTDHTTNCSQEICVRVDIAGTDYYYPARSIMDNVEVLKSIDINGDASITFKGKVRAGFIPTRIQFAQMGVPSFSLPTWFRDNDWQRFVYYAVSPGYAPGGGAACNAPPNPTSTCLTVSERGGSNSKAAIVTATSSRLAHQLSIPNNSEASYLEGENASPSDLTYENNTRSTTFNDQVIFVEP